MFSEYSCFAAFFDPSFGRGADTSIDILTRVAGAPAHGNL
jgi:hypothetical protein